MTGSDPISDAVVVGSLGGEVGDSVQASRRKKRDRPSAFEAPNPVGMCSNCATELSGPVCHSCGQTADTFHRPIWDLLMDILDGLLGLEGRLWRTIPPLMLQPGKITADYLSGVRARYVMPFRLYLTASVIFFLLVFALGGFGGGSDEADPASSAPAEQSVAAEEANAEGLDSAGEPLAEAGLAEAEARRDPSPEALREQQEAGRENLKLQFQRALLPEIYGDEDAGASDQPIVVDEGVMVDPAGIDQLPLDVRQAMSERVDRIIDSGGATLAASMQRWAPTMMFFLLPIYALMLAFMHFYKPGYFFYDHLVVSLHFHAFMLFLLTGLSLAAYVIPGGIAILIGLVWSNWYLYRLHRTVYSHGRFTSMLRVMMLDIGYFFLLNFALLGLLIVGVMTS